MEEGRVEEDVSLYPWKRKGVREGYVGETDGGEHDEEEDDDEEEERRSVD